METFKNNILILFAHPALQKSRVNKQLIKYVKDIDGITFHDLYEAYPDFHIRIKWEKDLLVKHNIIVFHHPLYWFSVPALLKEWMDLVLQHTWAYGQGGTALKGKKLISVITTGGREALYKKEGFHKHPLREFLNPIRQTANLCSMEYLPPFVVHGTFTITKQEIDKHGEDLKKVMVAIRDETIDFEKVRKLPKLNSDIDNIQVKTGV